MDYQNTLKYLYESAPMFQQIGSKAYKPGLETTHRLDEHFGHPHQQFKTIHIAGTNGKGSCSHTIAAVLQSAGYRVGLFTSPHLVDFRERIRINGEMMPEEYLEAIEQGQEREIVVCDYIAGMTDNYAVLKFQEAFEPSGWKR